MFHLIIYSSKYHLMAGVELPLKFENVWWCISEHFKLISSHWDIRLFNKCLLLI